jgi:L-ascorbate metabolism protein UlaG (beta-lactamase superfamily)
MDPFPSDLGLQIPSTFTRVPLVTISNDDPNQSASHIVSDAPMVLTQPGEYEASGFQIKGLRTRIQADSVVEPLWNTIFLINIEGITICHLGKLNTPLNARDIETLESPQVILLPVGGNGVLTPSDAADIANAIEPRLVIPMTYAHAGNKSQLAPLSQFSSALGTKLPEEQPRLSVTKNNLPSDMQVMVLQPAGTLI